MQEAAHSRTNRHMPTHKHDVIKTDKQEPHSERLPKAQMHCVCLKYINSTINQYHWGDCGPKDSKSVATAFKCSLHIWQTDHNSLASGLFPKLIIRLLILRLTSINYVATAITEGWALWQKYDLMILKNIFMIHDVHHDI